MAKIVVLGAGVVFYLRNYFFLIMGMPPTWPTPFLLGVLIIMLLAGAWIPGVLAGLYLLKSEISDLQSKTLKLGPSSSR